jgi:hypothetical protein
MDPLVRYYLHQTGRGDCNNNGIGPVYVTPLVLQRGYGIDRLQTGLCRAGRSVLWSGSRTRDVAHQGDILSGIPKSSPDDNARDIISKRVNESAQNLIAKLRGRRRKVKRTEKIAKLKRY